VYLAIKARKAAVALRTDYYCGWDKTKNLDVPAPRPTSLPRSLST